MIASKFIIAENQAERMVLFAAMQHKIENWKKWRPAHSTESFGGETAAEYRISNIYLRKNGYEFDLRLEIRRPRREGDAPALFPDISGNYTYFEEELTVCLVPGIRQDDYDLRANIIGHDGDDVVDNHYLEGHELEDRLWLKAEYI